MSNYIFTSDWFSPNIAIWNKILDQYKDKDNLKFLEIGSYEGRSAVWLMENILTNKSSTLVCIDTFEGSIEHTEKQKENIEEKFLYNTQKFKNKIIKVKGKSQERLRQFDPIVSQFDCIYIDGDHMATSVLEDIILSFPLLKKNGILILDDYGIDKKLESPQIAINAFLNIYQNNIKILHKGWQIILKKL